ncbi:hypothetical protein [Rhizorhabdus dicambivorans]|uniref:Type II secretion system protein GspC N-terminal domain-containing protein n=1 Tax=Rhizorhabdus dicambivorans TaxID=1850238 RepID=A0A2A4FUP2_9SPHN|nr:hypothetical protein [Rhizorhabdus dicambivorans]ATE63529.1 hypothetical protein CMV14_03165 [Rhizorhabdus dicambivorans]PCE41416.1 hypothetical protein COO09_15215 [Rhizorhabdus dicambivorans]
MRALSPWTAVAALFAVAVPAMLVWSTRPTYPDVVRPGATVVPSAVPPANIAARSLFLPPIDPARLPEVEGAPQLIGIAGRLPDKAVAMVRAADGTTRVLSPGQAHEGWTLESLSPDAALFTRGGRRVRSFLPAPEAEAPDEEQAEEGL